MSVQGNRYKTIRFSQLFQRKIALAIGGGSSVVLLLFLGLFVVANDGDGSGTSASAGERATLAAQGRDIVVAVEERLTGPPFQLQTASFADGSVFDLSTERGNVVVLYFMAAWCVTCIPEATALAQLHEDYAERGVRILVLDVDQTESEADLARFRERAGKGRHLWAMDAGYQVVKPYNVRVLDTTIIFDRDGRIAFGDGRPTSYGTLSAVAEALLH